MTDQIGAIVNSNSHIDYVCQLTGPLERERQPAPDAYAFGAFVAIDLPRQPGAAQGPPAEPPSLIGVIYNTLLVNPNFTNLGPRLTSHAEQTVFSPDLIDETAMLVGILALGWHDGARMQQGTPRFAAEVSTPVRTLTAGEVRQFHRDTGGNLTLRYAAALLALNNPLVPALLLEIIDRLESLFPREQALLHVMRDNVAWKSIVRPAG